MTSPTRLGGFKILKGVARISLVLPEETENHPAGFCRLIAQEKINLPYITCIHDSPSWGLNITVDGTDGVKIYNLLEDAFGKIFTHNYESAILSIFPHKKNPEITGRLFDVFGQEGVEPDALANSPSAISVILKETVLNRASNALFEPFSFSAYRTPADWKLAQKGKEQLYKEVVASYQEQRPKVYGLEYQDGQQLVQAKLNSSHIGQFGAIFKEFARLGLNFTFLATGPCQEKEKQMFAFGLPTSEKHSNAEIIRGIAPEIHIDSISPVNAFSMNGPHFGDRYGIASELLTTFKKNKIDLLGLSCTIASITGVVPSPQWESAIRAIQECFEVPSVTKKGS